MPDRWREELSNVEKLSPDLERLRARARQPSGLSDPPSPVRSRVVAGVIALVVFGLAASVFTVPTLLSSGSAPTPTPSLVMPTPPFVPGAPRADAVAEASRLVELTQVPPGSERLDHSPIPTLDHADGELSCGTEPCNTPIDAAAWWSIPLPTDEAIAWLQMHPPQGLFLNGDRSSDVGASGVVKSVSWTYAERPGPAFSTAELTMSVAVDGPARSALRVDGQLLWVPPRAQAEEIPDNVHLAHIREYHGRHVVASKVLDQDVARDLAWLLNHMGRTNMGPARCPMKSHKAVHYTMSFEGAQRSFIFDEWLDCRNGAAIFVTVNGHAEPTLSDSLLEVFGAEFASTDAVFKFLDCQLNDDPAIRCLPFTPPSPSPPADPVVVFCANLQQLDGWVATAATRANTDEHAAAEELQGNLSGVMMWFHPNEQAITDPEVRASADVIITDLLTVQNWPATGGSFRSLLDAYSMDSSSFAASYCQ